MPGQMHAPPAPSFNPQGPPQHPFQYGQPQGAPPPPPPPAGLNGYGQPPQQTASPGPGRSGVGHPGPPATPHQRQPNPYPGSPYAARPTPPPNQLQHPMSVGITQYTPDEIERIGNSLSDYEPEKLPSHYKRSGEDWHAVFNPKAIRRLDVDLVHTLPHNSVVCCVRFSQDGRYVATGCNRSAQIFDVETGQQVCKLQDSNASQDGDLYIRSVCFSPDGRYLATGAEDKIIRVSAITHSLPVAIADNHHRSGTLLSSSSDTNLAAMSKISTLSTLQQMVATSPLALVTGLSDFGIFKKANASFHSP